MSDSRHSDRPLISIVTSSFNQAEFIVRTIESVLSQEYPAIEHIVVDGMSTDGTPSVLARYPHLKVVREPDAGQADAINKGFRLATGQIFGFLNSDDTLEPGALQAVASAIAPASDYQIVMGRCRFIDERDRFLGVEHPSHFESHRRILEVWKGHFLPQPAVFFRREVWEQCGPMNVSEQLMLDYDLFCRLSRDYRFGAIDRILANYRLHESSKTTSVTDEQRLERAIAVSRRYWGSPVSWQYWQLRASYAAFRANRRVRAARRIRLGRERWQSGGYAGGVGHVAVAAAVAPEVVSDVVLMPALLRLLPRLSRVWRYVLARRHSVHPQTRAWSGLTRRHEDGWAGPVIVARIEILQGHAVLRLTGTAVPAHLRKRLQLDLSLDGTSLGSRDIGGLAEFSVTWDISNVPEGQHELRIAANTFMVPDDFVGNGDFRPLSYRVIQAQLEGQGLTTTIPDL